MCTPAALIVGGLGIASNVFGFVGQSQQANAQSQYQNQVYAQTGEAAKANYIRQLNTLGARSDQETAASSQQAIENRLNAARARADTVVASGESGISGGNTVSSLLNDFTLQESMNNSVLQYNLSNIRQQIGLQAQGLQAQSQSQVNSATPRPVPFPSLLGTVLTAGTTALSAYDSSLQQTRRGPYDANARDQFWPFQRLF